MQAKPRYERTPIRCAPARQRGNSRADIVAVLLKLNTLRSAIALLPARLQRAASKFTSLVRFAGSSFGLDVTAVSKREPVHIVAVGRSEDKKPVYNLTVDDAHLFYANGILSSNTDLEDHAVDALRYLAMAAAGNAFGTALGRAMSGTSTPSLADKLAERRRERAQARGGWR